VNTELWIQLGYLVASILFIMGLRGLGDAETARRGMLYAEVGMLIAVVATLLHKEIISYQWIIGGVVLGGGIGTAISLWIPMTKMPERIALSHAFGGLAVALVGIAEYDRYGGLNMSTIQMAASGFEVLLGSLTFTGSLMAFGKLQGILPSPPMTYPGQNAINIGMMFVALVMVILAVIFPANALLFYGAAAVGFLLGILLVVPIGGADMPVVICLLNSYAGLAASATGFALENNVLIICGALDGGSGLILAIMMSKAMNRSFANVLFGAFGKVDDKLQLPGAQPVAIPNEGSVDEAAEVLGAARSVIVVPGYGMAVSQAQHAVRELADVLQGGCRGT